MSFFLCLLHCIYKFDGLDLLIQERFCKFPEFHVFIVFHLFIVFHRFHGFHV